MSTSNDVINGANDTDTATTSTMTNIMNDEQSTNMKQLINNPNIHVADHPILAHKITILRSSATHSGTFRAVLKEITYHLGYEATRTSLTTKPITITVPMIHTSKKKKNTIDVDNVNNVSTTTENSTSKRLPEIDHTEYIGCKLKDNVSLIPILRSGLGMIDSMMELIPTSEVHHIGMYKSTIQDHPVLYYNKLPKRCRSNIAYILDPCIATASTIKSVVSILKKWGVPTIHVLCVIGSISGLQALIDEHPDIHITVGTIDIDHINVETGTSILFPGLGDSGDRLFGTCTTNSNYYYSDNNNNTSNGNNNNNNNTNSNDVNHDEEEDQSLIHPSKRTRTMSHLDFNEIK